MNNIILITANLIELKTLLTSLISVIHDYELKRYNIFNNIKLVFRIPYRKI